MRKFNKKGFFLFKFLKKIFRLNDNDNVDKLFKQQQEELQEANDLLRQYKNAVDKLLIVSKTDPKGIITYVNNSFVQISGYSADELIGKPHNIVRHPDMSKEIFKNMWDTIQRGGIWRGYIKNKRKDGTFYWVDTGILPVKNFKGEIIEYMALRVDVTFLIEAREKAKEAEKAKGIFLANMSHEIRTPLNAILGFTQLLEKKDNLDVEVKNYIRIINSSANTLLKIINDILDISKIESGNISIEKIGFNPNKIFSDVAALFLAKAQEKNINYKIDIDKLPECIKSDEHRLKQVISNLLGNAIKFTPENGEIIFSIKKLEENDKKIKLKFSVKDSGIGISKDKQKEIFKAFSQADGSIIRKFGGTGLGLTISSKIVQKLGGNIEVKSELAKGSEFYFILEFEKCDKVYEEMKKENKNVVYKAKILVAEDDILNQELIKAILKDWGIEFNIVSNGLEAVKDVKHNNYDFILLDINMPKMNGIEAVKEIKKLTNTPVIALSANVFKKDVESYFEAGFDDYISKPITLSGLEKIFKKYTKEEIENKQYIEKIEKKRTNYINSLQRLLKIDKNTLLNLLGVYFKSVVDDLKRLEIAIEKKDFEDIIKFAHKIKGSSLNLRFNEIGEIAQKIEKNAKDKNNINYKNEFNKMQKKIEKIKKEVENESNFV